MYACISIYLSIYLSISLYLSLYTYMHTYVYTQHIAFNNQRACEDIGICEKDTPTTTTTNKHKTNTNNNSNNTNHSTNTTTNNKHSSGEAGIWEDELSEKKQQILGWRAISADGSHGKSSRKITSFAEAGDKTNVLAQHRT